MSTQEMDYLAMSDEEWLKATPPAPAISSAELQDNQPVKPSATDTDAVDTAESQETAETEEASSPEPTGEGADADEDRGEETETPDPDAASAEESDDADDAPESRNENGTDKTAETSAEVDYKAVYEKLTRPFKANGKEIQVKDVDDAIALMQMGANYNKKMAALKPNLKLLKLLETHGLLSEEKLSFLIDVQNKNPAAISKLIKESGVDPLELDESKAAEYKPTTRRIDDREIELDQVLEEIQESPVYAKTLNVVSKEWDNASRQVIAEQPQLLKVLNAHMENGIFDTIQKELEHERMMGRLSGLSDIEAYRKIGDAIQARGGFNHLGRQVNTAPATKPVAPPSKPQSEAVVQKVKDRKRAASPTAASTPKPAAQAFNPLAMSDEEFAKLVKPQFL